MENLLSIIASEAFWHSVLRVTTPILFAAMAAIISQQAGVVNISLEGTMLFSSLIGVLASAATQNVWLGLLAAAVAGMLYALLLAYFSLSLKTDITLCGVALNLLASGGTIFLLYLVTGDKGTSATLKSMVAPTLNIPLLEDIPVLGTIFSGHNLLTYVAILCVAIVSFLLYKTPTGLRIRSVGEYPNAASSVGVSVLKVQYTALLASGLLAGLGGAFMSMGYLSWFSKDMIAGRGFVALAACAMGQGRPLGTLIASVAFGTADALSNYLQVLQVSAEFVMMIPYLAAVVGMILYSIKKFRRN